MNFEALQAAGATTAPASARDTATRPRVARIGRGVYRAPSSRYYDPIRQGASECIEWRGRC